VPASAGVVAYQLWRNAPNGKSPRGGRAATSDVMAIKEALNKLIPFMVRQAHHERNQYFTVHPEPFDKLRTGLSKDLIRAS
jgi:glycerol-3-phosphate dehydrogenase (NAD(P)+)